MIQGYYRTANLNACMKRLVNQYGIINPPDHDYNDDSDNSATKANFNSLWPKSIGDGFGTVLEQCQETDDYLFNIQLTQEQVDSMPRSDNPNFTFQYEGELDGETPLPLPTFKVKDYDEAGVWLGTYHDQTICVMR